MSELIKADNEYKEWITGISTDFRKSQIRASMKINDEMLRFYWKLGKGISSMSEQFGYGMGFYKTVSDDLKSILPERGADGDRRSLRAVRRDRCK